MKRPAGGTVWRKNGSPVEHVVTSCERGTVEIDSGETFDLHAFTATWTFVRKSNKRTGGRRCSQCGANSGAFNMCAVCKNGEVADGGSSGGSDSRVDRQRIEALRPWIPCPKCSKPLIVAKRHDRGGHKKNQCTSSGCPQWVWDAHMTALCCETTWSTVACGDEVQLTAVDKK